jgi:hypothetical protein
MRILIANDNKNAHSFIRSAFSKALAVSGHETILWNTWQKPVYDAFDEANPDLFFGQGYNLTPAFVKCIEERPDMSLVLRVSDWSKFNDELDKTVYPVLTASKKEIQFMKHIQTLPNKLVVHSHHHENWIKETHENWLTDGFDLYSFKNFADLFEYTNGEYQKELECDLSFIGGYWGYKAQNLDKYIMPLCEPDRNYKIRIFGNQHWATAKYCGFLPDEQAKHILKSTKVCLSVHEPHSTKLGYDIVTRPYNLMINKCFFVSDYVEGLKIDFPECITAKNPEEYEKLIQYYLNNQAEKNNIDILYKRVLEKHTAFERLVDIFNKLNLDTKSLINGKQIVTEKKNL